MCFGGKSTASARGTDIHRRHSELGKAISCRRVGLCRNGWDEVKKAYHCAMPVLEIDKRIDAMMRVESGDVADAGLEDDWTSPMPSFWCQEHERVTDSFFDPTAETLTGTEALSRRIRIINDLVALCGLRQPPERGLKVNWSKFEKQIRLDDPENSDSSDNSTTSSTDEATPEGPSQTNDPAFPTDECIFCAPFHPRAKQRPDSLRCPLHEPASRSISETDPVSYPHRVCSEPGVNPFPNRVVWLNHAARVHQYGLSIQLHRLSSKSTDVRHGQVRGVRPPKEYAHIIKKPDRMFSSGFHVDSKTTLFVCNVRP